MRFDSFPGRGELPVMHECPALIVEAPKFPGNKFTISCKESGRSGGLILVEGLALRISRGVAGGTDVMELEVRISRALN